MKRVSKLMLLFTVLFLSVSFLVFAGGEQEKAAAEGEEGAAEGSSEEGSESKEE